MKAITISVHVTNIATRVDNSLAIKLATAKELTPDEKFSLFELQNMECKILIQPTTVETDGLKEIKGEFDTKTPSQRIRAVTYVLWKYLTDTQQIEISFETFYLREMEKVINEIKSKLPDQVV